MSKEINNSFNTIFWTCIDSEQIDLYVTKLKSRIYKAIKQQSYPRLFFLQKKVFKSLSVRYLAVQILCQIKTQSFGEMYENCRNITIIEKLNFSAKSNMKLYSKIKDSSEIKEMTNDLIDIMLYSILEPQLGASITGNKYLSFRYFSPNNSSVKKLKMYNMYLLRNQLNYFNVNLETFLETVNLKFIISRLIIENSVIVYLKKNLSKYKILKFSLNTQEENNRFEKPVDKYNTNVMIGSLLIYSILLESCYIAINYVNKESVKLSCLNIGSEIVVASENMQYCKKVHEVINCLCLYRNITKVSQIRLFRLVNYYSLEYIFSGYSVSSKYYRQVTIRASKKSQRDLLNQVNYIFKKMKGYSSYELVSTLNIVLQNWLIKFSWTRDYKNFSLIDYILAIKLYRWANRHRRDLSSIFKNVSLIRLRKFNENKL